MTANELIRILSSLPEDQRERHVILEIDESVEGHQASYSLDKVSYLTSGFVILKSINLKSIN